MKRLLSGVFTLIFSTACSSASTGGQGGNGAGTPGGLPVVDCGNHGSIGSCGPLHDNCYCAGSQCHNPSEGEYFCIFPCSSDADCKFIAAGTTYDFCTHLPDGTGFCAPAATSTSSGGGVTSSSSAGGTTSSGGPSGGGSGSGSSSSSSTGSSGGGGGCTDPAYPVSCPGQHGVAPRCWGAGTSCATVVHCPWGDASCGAGEGVDCTARKCVPLVGSFESSNDACSNGRDDDGNGYIDCKDFHCLFNAAVTVCHGETTDKECSDGIDNDNNGEIDCNDLACRSSPAVTVCGRSERTDAVCNNGVDDDGNGYIDCRDLACKGSPFVSVCK